MDGETHTFQTEHCICFGFFFLFKWKFFGLAFHAKLFTARSRVSALRSGPGLQCPGHTKMWPQSLDEWRAYVLQLMKIVIFLKFRSFFVTTPAKLTSVVYNLNYLFLSIHHQPPSVRWGACGSCQVAGRTRSQHLHWKQRRKDPTPISQGWPWQLAASDSGRVMMGFRVFGQITTTKKK